MCARGGGAERTWTGVAMDMALIEMQRDILNVFVWCACPHDSRGRCNGAPVGDDVVRELLVSVAGGEGGATSTKITVVRKNMDDDW